MKRFLLAAALALTLAVSAYAGEVYRTKIQSVVYNDFDAFASMANQADFGQGTLRETMRQDVMRGDAIVLPKGTRVSVKECINYVCVVAVEGYSGYWLMAQPVIK
jgi:ABC-type amino acid transport system permease subunit